MSTPGPAAGGHIALRENLPRELTAVPGWLIWRYEQHTGEAKPRKVPYYAPPGRPGTPDVPARRRGTQGSIEDRAALVSFDEAREAALRFDFSGVGLAMLPEWGLVGLDFDNCFGKLDPKTFNALTAVTYREVSPSGNGVRAFFRGALPDGKDSDRVRIEKFGGFEVFHAKGFLTVTGEKLDKAEDLVGPFVADLPDIVREYAEQRHGKRDIPKAASEAGPAGEDIPDEQYADLRSALAHIAKCPESAGNEFWSNEIGYRLRRYGEKGLALWLEFCEAAPNGGSEAGQLWWNTHRDARGHFEHVFAVAQRLGWTNPRLSLLAQIGEFEDVSEKAAQAPPMTDKPEESQSAETQPRSGLAARFKLAVNDKGKPFSNLDNAARVVACLFHDSLSFDEFLNCKLVRWPEDTDFRPWTDADTTRLQQILQRGGMVSVSATAVADAVNMIARRRTTNIIADSLHSLKWDGTRRLSTWMHHAVGVPNNRYHIRTGRNWLISMVARALSPGCQVDSVVVLEGPQGVLKTSVFRTLGGPGFKELTADLESKDGEQQLRGVWLGEFSELRGLKRAEISRIKQFITNTVDHYRPSYAREEVDLPRRCVFVASTNELTWINDPTGARRFFPVEVGRVDLEWLRANREQLFAEAVALYKAGRKWWVWPRNATQMQQAERQVADPWVTPIEMYLYGRQEVTPAEVLEYALKVPTGQQTHAHLTRVGHTLSELGCVRLAQCRRGSSRVRPWSVPDKYTSRTRDERDPAGFVDETKQYDAALVAALCAQHPEMSDLL
jgi:Virulence-associated protein E